MKFADRLALLAAHMHRSKLDALLVTHLPDVRYLCGFTGSNAALVVLASASARGSARLFTDGRYTAQAAQEVHAATVRIAKKSALAEAVVFAANSPAARCGFDSATTTVDARKRMVQALSGPGVRAKRSASFLKATPSLVAALRERKDPDEVAALTRAAAVACKLYDGMLGWIEAGMRETDVAAELEHRARLAGAERMSFETIVAGGPRSGMPHARATSATLQHGQLLTLDFGIMLDGYCSDMTRTVQMGASTDTKGSARQANEQRTVFEAVLEAQCSAVAAVRPGATAGQVDEAARKVLRRAGLAKWFTHSTGHGVGLEIHEGPRIAAKQPELLSAGMVVTIEPGVYLPSRFGVRIEDTVLVTEAGCEILTPAYKGWLEL